MKANWLLGDLLKMSLDINIRIMLLWGQLPTGQGSGPHLNIKIIFPRYGDPHVKDETVVRPSHFWHGDPYTSKTTSLYWIRAQSVIIDGLMDSWLGNRLMVTASGGYVQNHRKVYMSVWRLVGNYSMTVWWQVSDLKIVLVLSASNTTNWRQVAHQPFNSPWPPSDHQKPFYIKLVTERFHLQQVKPPCKQIVLISSFDLCNLCLTSLRLPKIRVVREIIDQLQAMCDWGLTSMHLPLNWGHRWVIISDIKLLM